MTLRRQHHEIAAARFFRPLASSLTRGSFTACTRALSSLSSDGNSFIFASQAAGNWETLRLRPLHVNIRAESYTKSLKIFVARVRADTNGTPDHQPGS